MREAEVTSTEIKNNVGQLYPRGEVERGEIEEVIENLKVGELAGKDWMCWKGVREWKIGDTCCGHPLWDVPH